MLLYRFLCNLQDSEPELVNGVGAEAGHVIRTTIGGRNGQSRQVAKINEI